MNGAERHAFLQGLPVFKRVVVRMEVFPAGSTCCEAQTRLCEEQHMFSNNRAGVSSAGSEAGARCAKVIFKVFLAVTQIFLLFSHLPPSAQGSCWTAEP